jgi:hypothetical protein
LPTRTGLLAELKQRLEALALELTAGQDLDHGVWGGSLMRPTVIQIRPIARLKP